jgi:hypothetical protein
LRLPFVAVSFGRSLTPVAGHGCLIVFCCLDPKAQRDSDP